MPSERQVGVFASKVYRAIEAKQITRREALNMLEKVASYMSTSQYYKLMDLQDVCRHNPWMLDEK